MFTKEHIGRTVYDSIHYGEGKIFNFDERDSSYPIGVLFNGVSNYYSEEGRLDNGNLLPTLSFTPYTLEGYTNEPPKILPEVGEEILVSVDEEHWHIRVFDRINENNHCLDSTGFPWEYYKRFKEIE